MTECVRQDINSMCQFKLKDETENLPVREKSRFKELSVLGSQLSAKMQMY